MTAPRVETGITFGEQITLAGYDLNQSADASARTITFRPYWRIQQQPTTNYSMFVHLYPVETDQILVQRDGSPASLQRLTLTWDDPRELYIGSDVNLSIPADLPPGQYRLVIGLYDFNTGQRLMTPNNTDSFTISIEISGNS
jgi:hypothetical protein